ncbi:DUF4012 domain-containing protein [Patescibacteria group bacterium]|nr:DUF4012 domain-containing protein [Patescibacteria group bacterium]MBU2579931.1 DUF4012 domain-containing protein [Patescibacteria group bacterium]
MNELRMTKIIAAVCLVLVVTGSFMLWQNGWIEGSIQKIEQISFLKILPKLAGFGEERNYLLLFQNNLELRPSGGYLGAFGIIKIKNAGVVSFEMHDTNIFDGFGKVQTEPPQPMKEHLGISNWQMRDGNWSPDWPTAARQVEYFYRLQGGTENFDGVIALNASVLPDLMELIGPAYLEEFDKEFVAETVLYDLEYETERGYLERGIDAGERKTVYKALVKNVLGGITENNFWQKNDLRGLVMNELAEKNILLFFKDEKEQEVVDELGWSGRVDQSHSGDYLMIVEANLGARKSNAFVTREVEYLVDFSKDAPMANLKIKFTHIGGEKDWFNHDYQVYLRIYAPYKSWLLAAYGTEDETEFLDEFGKTVFGNWIIIPSGETKTVEFSYLLPSRLKDETDYQILVQKQSGINSLPLKFIFKEGEREEVEENIIKNDWEGVIERK